MRNVILVLGVLMFMSCSVDDSIEERMMMDEVEETQTNFEVLILGDWDDLSDDDENANFDGEKVVFSSGDVSFEYEYWINDNEITINFGSGMEIISQLSIDGDILSIGERDYLKI